MKNFKKNSWKIIGILPEIILWTGMGLVFLLFFYGNPKFAFAIFIAGMLHFVISFLSKLKRAN